LSSQRVTADVDAIQFSRQLDRSSTRMISRFIGDVLYEGAFCKGCSTRRTVVNSDSTIRDDVVRSDDVPGCIGTMAATSGLKPVRSVPTSILAGPNAMPRRRFTYAGWRDETAGGASHCQ
jgi:hypothetical protein